MSTPQSRSNSLNRVIHPALYGLTLVFVVIEFLITAILVSDYNRNFYPSRSIRHRIRFLLFTSCWSLLLLPVYIFANLRAAGQTISSIGSNLAFVLITWIFWLAGAAAWTDALGGTLHCGDIFLNNQTINLSIPYCHSLRAVQAFAWMITITITVALGYVITVATRSRKTQTGLSGPMREVIA